MFACVKFVSVIQWLLGAFEPASRQCPVVFCSTLVLEYRLSCIEVGTCLGSPIFLGDRGYSSNIRGLYISQVPSEFVCQNSSQNISELGAELRV